MQITPFQWSAPLELDGDAAASAGARTAPADPADELAIADAARAYVAARRLACSTRLRADAALLAAINAGARLGEAQRSDAVVAAKAAAAAAVDAAVATADALERAVLRGAAEPSLRGVEVLELDVEAATARAPVAA